MKEHERKQLLERVEREGATIGISIPETVEIDGESLDLRTFVVETKRREVVPPDQRERVEAVKRSLRHERTERKQRLESAAISRAAGEDIVEEIVGLDRALHALENLDSGDIEAERTAKATADQKRWLQFLKKALGRNGESGDRRARGGP